MGKPIADKGLICPFHKKDVSLVCHTCPLFVALRGHNPNTGAEVDEWGCALGWLPVLLIENSQQQRQTGAAVESFRNEMKKDNETMIRITAMQSLAPKQLE